MTKLTDVLEFIDSCSDKQWLKFCECMEIRGFIIEGKYLHDYDYPHVIRCKDCKHYRKNRFVCDLTKYASTDVDFCSWAKRKEE